MGNQRQPAQTQQPQFKFYNFDRYLFNNNKLIRMLTLLSIFGGGIDLSRLVPQTDIAQIYVAGNKQVYPKRTESSVLISMAKDKFLNEKNILGIDSKYVKYSVYDLLRYFLIFNGFDSSNFIKYITGNIGYTRNNSNLNNDDFIIRASRGQQSLLEQQSLIEQLKKNKEEISFMLAKKVIELRMKKRTRQQFKSDEFSKTKKELARLLTVKEILSNSKVNNIFSEKNSTSMGS